MNIICKWGTTKVSRHFSIAVASLQISGVRERISENSYNNFINRIVCTTATRVKQGAVSLAELCTSGLARGIEEL